MFHIEAFSKSYSRQAETRREMSDSRLVSINRHRKPRKLKLCILTAICKSYTKRGEIFFSLMRLQYFLFLHTPYVMRK